MDKKQINKLTIEKLPCGGYMVSNGHVALYASLKLQDCFNMVEEYMTFDDRQKSCPTKEFLVESTKPF